MGITVRAIDLGIPEELESALRLVGHVFDIFEAPEYPPEGVAGFHAFITPEACRPALEQGSYKMWVAVEEREIVGVIAIRASNHISLFFVDERHHRQGIGRMLLGAACAHALGEKRDFLTVFSSPYAVPIYERLGFVRLAEEQIIDGFRCNPMAMYIKK